LNHPPLQIRGVLNGLDYEQFNPQTDPHIPAKYSADTIEKKYENKRSAAKAFMLADNDKPIVSFVGRLDPQKGLELVRHAIFYALGHGAQFVLLGSSPDASINEHFWGLKRHFNDNPDCHLEIAYNEEVAHLIYAGADMIVVPSRYEPCGLTQIIAMAFGTVRLWRAVGGLADTVFDKDFPTGRCTSATDMFLKTPTIRVSNRRCSAPSRAITSSRNISASSCSTACAGIIPGTSRRSTT